MTKRRSNPHEPPQPASHPFDNDLADSVRESAQQIWLAGLGAFAKAQAEGGKVFEALVQDGATLQRRTQELAGRAIADVSARASQAAEDAGAKASRQMDKLEGIFEQRVATAMGRLGVPSAMALEALAARVDALAEEVRRLTARAQARGQAGAQEKPAAGRTPRKPE